jgi:hypothetical protein
MAFGKPVRSLIMEDNARCPFHKFIISQAAKRLYGLGG